MKYFFRFFTNLFNISIGKIFFVANIIICLVFFNWNKLFLYLDNINEMGCRPRGGGAIDFSVYGFYGSSASEEFIFSIIMIFVYLFIVILFILFSPSICLTEIMLGSLKQTFAHWCPETFDLIYTPIFFVFNSFYWIFLGDIIEMAHSAYLQRKPMSQKFLSIFPD